MQWAVKELVSPLARRLGGQAAAALVALGMAQAHESAVAAAIAWVLANAVEVFVSKRSRDALVHRVKTFGAP
jgi:hypothetical protein